VNTPVLEWCGKATSSVTGNRDPTLALIKVVDGYPGGGQVASPTRSTGSGLPVTNRGSRLPKSGIDAFGFKLVGAIAYCTHCPCGGALRDWPQWKRAKHYEAEHKRQALAAKRAATRRTSDALRKALAEESAKYEPPTAAEALDLYRQEIGCDPSPAELICWVEDLAPSAPAPDTGPLPESVKRRERRGRSKRWDAAREPRACRECGGEYTPADARQVFCSAKCRKRYAYMKPRRGGQQGEESHYGEGQVASRKSNAHGALPVTNEGSNPPKCARCEEPFKPTRTDQRYCSNACRQAAYRERQREAGA